MQQVEQWRRFELTKNIKVNENPFTEVKLFCKFTNGKRTKIVRGFFDGNNEFKIRFMPDEIGVWSYITESNISDLNGISGEFECTEAVHNNHGMVITRNNSYFEYSDGTPYAPFGTTLYAWQLQDEERMNNTIRLLKENKFNKVRMVVFPIWNYMYTKEYTNYPYLVTKREKIKGESEHPDNYIVEFDHTRFDPGYFNHLEKSIEMLIELDIQVDLILFHPYNDTPRGLCSMTQDEDFLYIEYIVSRLASYKDVWWSMANEYDLADMTGQKPLEAWDALTEKVYLEDPNRHLLSIHNFYDPPIHKHTTSNWFDHTKPWITHLSIQTDNLFFIDKWKKEYRKPIVIDECRYEGNVQYGWGNLTAQHMTDSFWKVVARGGYVTHGESYVDGENPTAAVWTFHGSELLGESHLRMNYLREIIERNNMYHLDAIATTGPHWELYCGATEDKEKVLIYFGDSQPGFEIFDFLPDGKSYSAELIDTWNMNSEHFDVEIDNKKFFEMPNNRKYIALVLTAK